MYSKGIPYAVPRPYQYVQNAARPTVRAGCYVFDYFSLYHARTTWDQIPIVQYSGEYLTRYVIGIVARRYERLSAE